MNNEFENVTTVTCTKDGHEDFCIDMTIPKNEPVLRAFQRSGWRTFDQDGHELFAPEIETHPVKLFWW